jgi:hypothetical protein
MARQAEESRIAAARAQVFEAETQTEDERDQSPPPRPSPPSIFVIDEDEKVVVRPLVPVFIEYLQVYTTTFTTRQN